MRFATIRSEDPALREEADNDSSLNNIRKALTRWLTRAEDVDDVLQTVGEKLLRANSPTEPAYLNRMYRNAAIDLIRAESTRHRYEQSHAIEHQLVEQRTPDRTHAGQQAVTVLDRALSELSPLNRDIFLRAYLYDQPRDAIARELGLHKSAVEKRLAKAKLHCYEIVKPHL
ncbi:MAG: sigma-70 family RNA polymerase sigma factor [Pseudomonadota bacterium]